MKKIIYATILITLFSHLSVAQETTVWLNGSKADAEIVKKKANIETQGFKVFVNDTAEREKRHLAKPTPSGDEKFDRIFREARELFDKEEWAKAAEKFNQIVCDCPENKQVDAALYWLAYSYKKLGKANETNATIERLLKNFPNSTWADDARVLKYENATANTWNVGGVARSGQSGGGVAPRIYTTNPSDLLVAASVGGNYVFSQENKLDREDEIRLAAFQSLFANDPKRGIEALGRLLQSDSKASENLKREVLRTLRGSRFYGLRYPGTSSSVDITPTILVTQINPMLRDTLAKGFQSESNAKVRAEIIYSIAYINDEPSYNFLAQTYANESNKDLKKAIINSFGLVTQAFYGDVYAARKVEIEQAALATAVAGSGQKTTSPTQTTNPIRELRFSKLMEIFRNEKDLELRRLALSTMQRFVGWSTREGMVGMLSQLYDAEPDDLFKLSIISSFGNLNKNSQATSKLLDIAKNDKSDKMRLEAIRALRNNNSPEVLQFLEDLIK